MFKLKKLNQVLEETNEQLTKAQNDLYFTQLLLKNNQHLLSEIDEEIKVKQEELSKIKNTIDGFIELEDTAYELSIPESLTEIQEQIWQTETDMANCLGANNGIIITKKYKVDGSTTKGNTFQFSAGKNLVTAFNVFVQSKEKSITPYNHEKTIQSIQKQIERLNKTGDVIGVRLCPEYTKARLDNLNYKFKLKVQKAQIKAEEKIQKQRLKEQEKLLEDIAKAEEELAKEQRYYKNLLGRKLTEEERQEYQTKLSEVDKRIDDCNYRKANLKAGWVYIIQSKAMPNMTKIGATRRLDPLVRIRELSSASVPFPFQCYGVIFCNDVFDTESEIHKYLDQKRVGNNKHKEFFYITPTEAISAISELGYTITLLHQENDKE